MRRLYNMHRSVICGLAAVLSFLPALAFADDWTADKLRGSVLQFIDGQWQPLSRGMVVPDSRVIRTTAAGHVTLTRGEETVELGPDTQVRIHDKGGKKPFTTVKQYFGTVSVEAQVQNVQHFAVDTPFLAAVVKGTRFVVTSGKDIASVAVRRGHVAVEDKHDKSHVLLSVGQSATTDSEGRLEVAGSGDLPVVFGADGKPAAPSQAGKSKDKANGDTSGDGMGLLLDISLGSSADGNVSAGDSGPSGSGGNNVSGGIHIGH